VILFTKGNRGVLFLRRVAQPVRRAAMVALSAMWKAPRVLAGMWRG